MKRSPGKIVGIGLNYRDHAEEQGKPLPEEPLIFAKFPSAVIDHGDSIILPAMSHQVDYEGELAVVIGKRGRQIPEDRAHEYVEGYTIINDVSARDLQARDKQFVRAKSFDTFAPMGPRVVKDVGDVQNLAIRTWVNGDLRQSSSTNQMIFTVARLIAFISEVCTLEPGDVIATGTPGGVGVSRKPPVFLKSGDIVKIEIERIGILENPVKSEK